MFELIMGSIIISTLVFWFWALWDIYTSIFKTQKTRFVGILIILFSPILGSIIYFQLGEELVLKNPRMFQPDFNKNNRE